MHTLSLTVLDRGVRVRCVDPVAGSLLSAAYGAMQGATRAVDLDYTVRRQDAPGDGFRIERSGRRPVMAPDDGTLLALFDADIAIEIQRLRPDLYVVHAAVLEHGGAAVMLIAKSGGGKSTLCWALLHHDFRYLSDELAPVDLATLDVLPYPRALMVKRDPPGSYPMTAAAVRTSRSVHVPASALPSQVRRTPTALAAAFFLQYDPAARCPSARRISPAEAAARLYANTLNALAHGGDGIDGAIRITAERPCFELITADLVPTCALLSATLHEA